MEQSDTDNFLSYAWRSHDEVIRDIRHLVEIESPTIDKSACDVAGGYLAGLFGEYCGARITWFRQQNYGNHFRAEVGEGKHRILVLGHFDTVWPMETVSRMPCQVQGDRMFGPGIYDMKAGDVQALWAFRALAFLSDLSSRTLVFLGTSDEEIGSPTSRALIEKEAASAVCVLVLEPSAGLDGGVKLWRKGVGRYEVHVAGVASHAGAKPEEGASATLEIAHQIIALNRLSDISRGTTVNVGRIEGGTQPNVVAASASAEIDIRMLTSEEAARVDKEIRRISSYVAGTRVSVCGEINRPPMEVSPASRSLFRMAAKIATKYGFKLTESGSGGASDGNFTAAMGIPTLDGLGAVGAGAHADNEHILISVLDSRLAWLSRLLAEI